MSSRHLLLSLTVYIDIQIYIYTHTYIHHIYIRMFTLARTHTPTHTHTNTHKHAHGPRAWWYLRRRGYVPGLHRLARRKHLLFKARTQAIHPTLPDRRVGAVHVDGQLAPLLRALVADVLADHRVFVAREGTRQEARTQVIHPTLPDRVSWFAL